MRRLHRGRVGAPQLQDLTHEVRKPQRRGETKGATAGETMGKYPGDMEYIKVKVYGETIWQDMMFRATSIIYIYVWCYIITHRMFLCYIWWHLPSITPNVSIYTGSYRYYDVYGYLNIHRDLFDPCFFRRGLSGMVFCIQAAKRSRQRHHRPARGIRLRMMKQGG